jgi:hypothetical protein
MAAMRTKTGMRARVIRPTFGESRFVIGLSATTLFLFFAWTIYMRYYFQYPSTLDDPLVPPYFKQAEDAKPFPKTLDPSQFLPGEIREAYSIAREMPDVLAQQPSYCRRPAIPSLLHCFKNLEATNCEMCVEEARLAGQLIHQGKSAPEIRAAIVQRYGVVSARTGR